VVNMGCMKRSSRKRSALIALGLLLVVLAVPTALTRQTWRQSQLNRNFLIAISKNDLHALERLLSAGADANAQFAPAQLNLWQLFVSTLKPRSSFDVTNSTSLMYVFAVASTPLRDASGRYLVDIPGGYRFPPEPVAMVQLLLRHGAKPGGKYSDGSALLLMPIAHRWTKCVRLMLEAGANPNATDKYGLPVMRCALLLQDTDTVQALIEHHADVNWKDDLGRTPLRYATELHDTNMLRLLKRAGAKQ
jgi:hypothetical protein